MRVFGVFFYYILLAMGLFFSFFTALMIMVFLGQLTKNRKIYCDFNDRIQAVYEFRIRAGRLPTESELDQLSAMLPIRHSGFDYEINTTLAEVPQPMPGNLNGDNWTLSFWRGEWSEYYLTWNGVNTLEWQSSFFRMSTTFVFPPLIASIGCFLGAWKQNQSVKSKFLESVF